MSPFWSVYEKACHLPVEIEHKAYWTVKECNMVLQKAGVERKLQLEELECLRLETYDNARIYKKRTKTVHDQHIKRKEFQVGNLVILYNSGMRLLPKKLKSRWDHLYIVDKVEPYGVVHLRHLKLYHHTNPKSDKEVEFFFLKDPPGACK
ncbi:uncharacterized protein LOC107608914 [Arachis ipaensis]|uniref:uncharacterized protein LOC107608914 n=1 Tax=Arachis ipaensis TaxID=130454 RepID=UPI0007AF2397|nr:uncharacterized protein LOC107608914 [Arachis ipaensis]XP_025628407.1 uncharacterized protein LOC112721571 [Arachis hypogaea]